MSFPVSRGWRFGGLGAEMRIYIWNVLAPASPALIRGIHK
jgi:hypothetical protein